MFTKDVTYVDFNGKPHNETLMFHMMIPDFADLEWNPMFETSLSDFIKDNMGSGEGRKVFTVFKLLVANSYGRRSEDGSRFVKKAEWTEEFLNSNAWEQFFLWLTETEDGKNGQEFFNGIFPESLREKAEEFQKAQDAAGKKVKPLTEMTRDELEKAFLEKQAQTTRVIEG